MNLGERKDRFYRFICYKKRKERLTTDHYVIQKLIELEVKSKINKCSIH